MAGIDSMPRATSLSLVLSRKDALPRHITLDDPDASASLDAWYETPASWWRMNMIGSLNGKVAGPDGTSDSLSNRADRAILQRIRALSDAVLVGAETVRNEQHAPTGGGTLVIVTGSGNLKGHRLPREEAESNCLVLCPESARQRVHETLPGAPVLHPPLREGQVEIASLRSVLEEAGFHRVVVEGGQRLISQCLDEGLLDEVCLTQAPVFGDPEAIDLPGSARNEHWLRYLVGHDELDYLYQRLVREDRLSTLTS